MLHAFSYKAGGELLSADDLGSDFAYAYDGLGRVTQVDNDGTPGVPREVLDMTCDANGNRAGLSATIGMTSDFFIGALRQFQNKHGGPSFKHLPSMKSSRKLPG